MASNFPKLPGFVPTHDPTLVDHKKISHIKLEQIRNPKNVPVPLYTLPRGPNANFSPEKGDESKSFSQTVFKNHYGKDIQEQFEPTFVKLDKQVLRFFGYFKESVVESRLENYRIRKLTIYYYLEDHSIMINEPKQTNSGTPQGIFLKRQMVIKQDGSKQPLLPQDFRVGLDVGIYGRTIRITDCDQYTREFFDTIGQSQPDPIPTPGDNFSQQTKFVPKKKDAEMKEFLEKALGGGRVASQKQFLDNDRKVLRFFTRCDDLPFVIHYYLADDTVEIREVHYANDGRDPFSLLLRRQKLPQSFAVNQPGQNFIGDNYLTCDEIEPGGVIDAFGRAFRIYGVDQFTHEYLKQRYGKHFEIGDIEFPKPREPKPLVIPPHNGFGDEVDSLGYVYKLLPDKPKRDFFKYVDNDKKILRFTARFNTRVPEDLDRRFIISFYLSDDTISIFEPAQKNSGIMEGKFLERRKYKNVDKNGDFITPTDLALGGDVKINGYLFHILTCDEYTQNYLDGHTY